MSSLHGMVASDLRLSAACFLDVADVLGFDRALCLKYDDWLAMRRVVIPERIWLAVESIRSSRRMTLLRSGLQDPEWFFFHVAPGDRQAGAPFNREFIYEMICRALWRIAADELEAP